MNHRAHVAALLRTAAIEHERTVAALPPAIAASLPVDAQGLTQAIDVLAAAAGLSEEERRALVRPHAANPAVMHVRVFGVSGLDEGTVVGAFIEGARVRADALTVLASAVGGDDLVAAVRAVLVADPPPPAAGADDVDDALRATYAAQERAALLIAAALDA